MEIFNGIIRHTQGESFTLDMDVKYPNGDPYIISSELENPYILFTIASTQYTQNNRYIMRHWLDASFDYPRFYQTRPNETLVAYPDIKTPSQFLEWLNINTNLDDWDSVTGLTKEVYHLNNNTYWYGVGQFDNLGNLVAISAVKEYKCRIILSFSHEETKNMVGQSYVYFIEGVNGVKLNTWLLQELYDIKDLVESTYDYLELTIDDTGNIHLYSTEGDWKQDLTQDVNYQYDLLKSIAPDHLKDITKDQPIVITDTTNNDIIVNDGEWKVVTNVNGRGLNRWQTL